MTASISSASACAEAERSGAERKPSRKRSDGDPTTPGCCLDEELAPGLHAADNPLQPADGFPIRLP